METILVVDDSQETRNVAGGCLSDHGVKAIYAGNGRETLKILENQRPDAVLTDLHMPEMDGLELVEYMRMHHSNVPVVLMTANGSENRMVKGCISERTVNARMMYTTPMAMSIDKPMSWKPSVCIWD